MAEHHLLQLENEVFLANPEVDLPKNSEENQLLALANEEQQELHLNLPAPVSPVNYLVDEIPLDQLVGPGEEGFPEDDHVEIQIDLNEPADENGQNFDHVLPENEENLVENNANQAAPVPAEPEDGGEEDGQNLNPVLHGNEENLVENSINQAAPVLAEPEDEPAEEGAPILPEQNDLLAIGDEHSSNQSIQVGMVMTSFESFDPVEARAKQAEATKLWAIFFSLGIASTLHVNIPTHWTNFFTVMLLSPNQFQWAKNLLSSKIPELLMHDKGSVEFSIPSKCPDSNLDCVTLADEEGTSRDPIVTPNPRKRSPRKL